jgi:drug/metabolite transporter (DMT)-like permease
MLTSQNSTIRSMLRNGQVIEIEGQTQLRRNTSPSHASGPRLMLAFAAIYLIWGSTYLAIRFAVESIPPLLMMGVRHLVAGILLYAWVRLRGAPPPRPREWISTAIAGAMLFLGAHGSLAWAEQRVPSGLAALLSATLPLWVVLLARFKGRDRHLGWRAVVGLILGFVGVAILIGPDAFHSHSQLSLLGAAAVMFGAFMWGLGTIYAQDANLPSSSRLSAAMQMATGGISLGCVGLLTGEAARLHLATVTAKSAFSLAYLIVFGSIIAFTAFTWLNTASSPTRVSTYAYINPLVAVLLGWALANEAIGARTLIATAVILTSVALVNRRAHEPAKLNSRVEDETLEAAGD